MKNKEYIKNLTQTIINRVELHAPILYDNNIKFESIKYLGININLPIFKFEKKLTKNHLKAFILAQKSVEFNLILFEEMLTKKDRKLLAKIKNLFIINSNFISLSAIETINKLNINYYSKINFKENLNENYFSIYGEVINLSYKNMFLSKKEEKNDVFFDLNMFLLNGQNYFLKLNNKLNHEKEIDFEINIPLKKGYYFFKKMSNCIVVENITTKEKLYFNFSTSYQDISFSHIDGLENSTLACINLKVKTKLKPKEHKAYFFNFGDTKFILKNQKIMEKFFILSVEKLNEIFNLKIKTNRSEFDYNFNYDMPRRIIINWLNFSCDKKLEYKYFSFKNSILEEKDNQYFLKKNFNLNIKEVGIFNGEIFKKILIFNGDEKLIQIGHTKFFNVNSISKNTIKKNESISLCFG
ncbi:MAG: hypothetical protein IJ008_04040 [Clostridia bacterium]|nr:hypothetical protein [Clostridia bacterium]